MRDALQSQFEQIQSQIDERYGALRSTMSSKLEEVNKKRDDLLDQANEWAESHDLKDQVRERSQKLFSLARKKLHLVKDRIASRNVH